MTTQERKYHVYGLYSPDHGKIYVGHTSDLPARLKSHNELGTKGWTIRFRPWKVIYTEECETKRQALRRERELKTAKGRAFMWDQVRKHYPEAGR